ncbi:MAG: helix-turn-helix domain-containing protein [Methylococcales bacterium]|nr:helix-turn-helix domain-containing protein [Methylococcales bacterium]
MKITPLQYEEAVTYRLAGYTIQSIAERTGISPATLFRHFKTVEAKKGECVSLTVESAKERLLNDSGFISQIKDTIAASIVDELDLIKALRLGIALSLHDITNDTVTPAVLKSRALSALATALSVTQTVSRKALNLDAESQSSYEHVPELTIRCMSAEDVAIAKKGFIEEEEDDELLSET